MDDLRNLTSFDDISEWLMSNREILWQNAFLDVPMPKDFYLLGLDMGSPPYREDAVEFDGRRSGGFTGKMKVRMTHNLNRSESCRMFRETGIIISETRSWCIESKYGFERAVENGIPTHTLSYVMIGEEWLNLSVFRRLSDD